MEEQYNILYYYYFRLKRLIIAFEKQFGVEFSIILFTDLLTFFVVLLHVPLCFRNVLRKSKSDLLKVPIGKLE